MGQAGRHLQRLVRMVAGRHNHPPGTRCRHTGQRRRPCARESRRRRQQCHMGRQPPAGRAGTRQLLPHWLRWRPSLRPSMVQCWARAAVRHLTAPVICWKPSQSPQQPVAGSRCVAPVGLAASLVSVLPPHRQAALVAPPLPSPPSSRRPRCCASSSLPSDWRCICLGCWTWVWNASRWGTRRTIPSPRYHGPPQASACAFRCACVCCAGP